ncbi:MAG: carboxypeptidase-like regulatory domain-containing protein, partial [Ferruginibacter sp.]
MYRLTLCVLFFSCFALQIKAQQKTILSGKIQDTIGRAAVNNAVVALLTPVDSVLVKFTRSSASGEFTIKDIDTGNYIVTVLHPTFADYVDNIQISGTNFILPLIPVTPKSKLLEAVILKSGSPIRIKGDTTIYTADSFNVSANANVEELL